MLSELCKICNLNKIVWSKLHEILSILALKIKKNKNKIILEDVSEAEEVFNAELLISRLPSFSIPKVTKVRYV